MGSFIEGMDKCRANIVISQRQQCKHPLEIDSETHKWHHFIKKLGLYKLKHDKAIAMRADKTDRNLDAMMNGCVAIFNAQ